MGTTAGAGHPEIAREPVARPGVRAWAPVAPPERKPIPWPSSSGAVEQIKPKGISPCKSSHRPGRGGIDKARRVSFRRTLLPTCPGTTPAVLLKEERGYRVRKEIREMVIIAPQNLIMDPPFTKLTS